VADLGGLSQNFQSDFRQALVMVPEPALISTLAGATIALRRRR
jgi:hypothetical protein